MNTTGGSQRDVVDYARPVAWHRRRRTRRWIAPAFLVVAGCWFGPGVWRHARVLWFQRQCMTYAAPVDQLVYDDTPALPLPGSGRGMVRVTTPGALPATVVVRPVACWEALRDAAAPTIGSASRGDLVYLHSGRDRIGKQRLVAVMLDYRSNYQLRFKFWALEPATPISSVGLRGGGFVTSIPIEVAGRPLRLYAGQPDPLDPSHFTMRYEIDGKPGTIDGRFEEGAAIHLIVRDGPAAQRPR